MRIKSANEYCGHANEQNIGEDNRVQISPIHPLFIAKPSLPTQPGKQAHDQAKQEQQKAKPGKNLIEYAVSHTQPLALEVFGINGDERGGQRTLPKHSSKKIRQGEGEDKSRSDRGGAKKGEEENIAKQAKNSGQCG